MPRDPQRENLFLTRNGRVKIPDFGLAKLARPAPPTRTAPPRCAGWNHARQVMGTVAYMAAEQVRVLAADARTDIFA